MARTVTYSVVPRYNPNAKNEPPRYYARAQASGEMTLREMAERIQQSCMVTKAEVHAVLVAMEDVIIGALKVGEMVRMGDLGTLQIGLSGKGSAIEEDYEPSLITKARINFRPGVALVGFLTSLSFSKVEKKTEKVQEEEDTSAEEPTVD